MKKNRSERTVHGSSVRSSCDALCIVMLLGAVSGCAVPSTSQPSLQIGVVDAQRVLEETKAGQNAKETLSAFTKNRQELITLEERELKSMEAELLKQASVLNANARKAREEKFRRRMIQYQRKAAEMNREVQEKQREVLDEFRGEVERVVTRIALEMGLVAVLEKGRGGPLVYSDASIDISDQVIRKLNER